MYKLYIYIYVIYSYLYIYIYVYIYILYYTRVYPQNLAQSTCSLHAKVCPKPPRIGAWPCFSGTNSAPWRRLSAGRARCICWERPGWFVDPDGKWTTGLILLYLLSLLTGTHFCWDGVRWWKKGMYMIVHLPATSYYCILLHTCR